MQQVKKKTLRNNPPKPPPPQLPSGLKIPLLPRGNLVWIKDGGKTEVGFILYTHGIVL